MYCCVWQAMGQGKIREKSFPRFCGAHRDIGMLSPQLGVTVCACPREISHSYTAPVGINSGI